jgi:uncharacterized phage protein gp47/JayE
MVSEMKPQEPGAAGNRNHVRVLQMKVVGPITRVETLYMITYNGR